MSAPPRLDAPAPETGAARVSSATAATQTPASRRGGRRWLTWLGPLAVLGLILAVWYLITYVVLTPRRRFLMPPPHEVLTQAFLDDRVLGRIGEALALTVRVAVTGLVIAIVLGMVWAVLMSQARWVERSLFPYAVILQCIPILALVPLIGFWFGFGFASRVIVCVLIALFPIVINTLFGLQSVDAAQHDLFTLHNASRWTRLSKLQFPAALPAIFVGLRNAAGLSVVGAIVGDLFFKQGDPGIGILLDNYRARLQSAELFAAIIVASLLGVVVFLFFGWLGKRVVGRWYDQPREGV
jgi:NitT/TauT family transport system permease protein